MKDSYQSKVMRDLEGFFKPGQREAIYNACDNARDRLLIRMLWKSGRRVGEILQMRCKDIDWDNNMILWNIEKKKRKHRAWKPIDKITINMIKSYITPLALEPEDWVFMNLQRLGGPISRQRVFQILRKAATKAGVFYVGIKKPHPHHFRHSFAVDMAKKLKSPADMSKLQKFMEHANMGMTEQYLQFSDEDLRTLIEEE